ncbi:hypothetical protein DU152_03460 [Salmonella enterica subsp. diarizonae]|nr:hypothetical protein [Salmonella enterica subsp. diarizonae]
MKKSQRAQSLERSESLAIEVLNLNQRAQDNPTVMRTITTAPIWLQFSLPDVSAHNVYYVKYAGFVVKFMRTSLSGTYRRISRLLKFSCGFTITS